MENILIGDWVIEYDPRKTCEAYTKCKTARESCTCITCENYFFASQHFPEEVNNFFKTLAIDPIRPAEIYDNGIYEDGRVLYGGFYHIVGSILSGKDVWQPVRRFFKRNHRKQVEMLKIIDGFEVGFTLLTALVDEHFPRPVCQMEISFWVPWIIDKPYPS